MPDLRERWRTSWLEATAFDSVIEHEHLARVIARLTWGVDAGGLYREIARLPEQPDGSAILDIPCGGGVAFRALRPGQRLRLRQTGGRAGDWRTSGFAWRRR